MKLIRIIICIIIATASLVSTKKRIICYYQSWTIFREGKGKFDITNTNPKLCTHIIYAYIGISPNGEIITNDDYLDVSKAQFAKIINLKTKNPKLKLMVSLGGWKEGSSKIFSDIAKRSSKREKLIKNALKFVIDRNLDGMELAWCYPGFFGGNSTIDIKNYVTLAKELKQGFADKNLIISTKVIGIQTMAKPAYNIKEISKHFDFINIICYDFYGPWNPEMGIHNQLFQNANKTSTNNQESVDSVISYWIKNGASRLKINIGIGFHGRTYKLIESGWNTPGANHAGGGLPGPYTAYSGVICYNELCELFKNEDWNFKWDDNSLAPYAFTETQWVAYENIKSVELKARYANENNLGGIMIFYLECDDFSGKFDCEESEQKYPLLRTIKAVLNRGAQFPTYEYSVQTTIMRKNLKYNTSISIYEDFETFYED